MPQFSFGKSIKTQLIVLLFGLSAVSIGIVGFLGVRGLLDSGHKAEAITSTAAEARAQELLVQTTNATADKNSLLFKNIQTEVSNTSTYIENIFDNPTGFTTNWRFDDHVLRKPTGQYWNASTELPNILLGNFVGTPSATIKKNIELLHNLDYLAPQTLTSNSNAAALYFIGELGESFYYPNIDLGNIIPQDLNPNTLDFYTIANPKNNPEKNVKWTKVYDDPAGNGLTITASDPVYKNKNTFIGVASMDVTLSNIAKNIESYSPIESSYSFLIDSDGRAIALPGQGYSDLLGRGQKKAEFGADLQKVTGGFGTVLKHMRDAKTGFATVTANNSNLYVAYAPVSGTTFSLGIVAKKDVLLKVVGDLQIQVQRSTKQVLYFQILPFAVLILLLVWVLGFIYIRFITEPIIALTEKTNKIMQGSFTQEINVKTSNNEVGKLAAAFNKMTSELAASYKALERKVVEIGDAKAKDDAILNSIGDGLIVTGGKGEILLMNKIAANLMGFEQADKLGQNIADRELFDAAGVVLPENKRPVNVALASGKKVNRDVVATASGDVKIALNITANPVLQHNHIIGAIQIIRDVTKEKEVERMKTEFISIASHQLRTPLSAIKWFAEMLIQGDAGKLQDGQTELIKNINESTNRMIELVNSLLNISRLESGRILVEPVPTDLKQLIAGIVDDLKGRTQGLQQKFTITVDDKIPHIKLDPRLISQVYLNLITNSIKYTPKGGTITVSITRKGNEVISEVTDTGYGIPAAEQKKMFKKFFRGTNIVQVETDGTGLGMYLAKSIIESSNGKIWFKSQEGKGTSFWFSLPMDGMKAKEGEVTLD